MCQRLRLLARSDVDLLLGGETGVGKEVFAEAIHRESGRKGPLVAINCAALPDTLLESELFGFTRGAHSMADQGKPGLIERAEGGTLFLDEIGEMSQERAVQTVAFSARPHDDSPRGHPRAAPGRSRRRRHATLVSPKTTMPRDSGSIWPRASAPNRWSSRRCAPGPRTSASWRVISCAISPALSTSCAYRGLFLRQWPGNIRELEKTLRLASVLSEGRPQIDPQHLGFASVADTVPPTAAMRRPTDTREIPAGFALARPTPDHLATLLDRHQGNVADVARELGRQRTLVWRWLRKFGLDPGQFRRAGDQDPPS